MPKVSFASSDQYEPKLGFQEGWFEIVGAKTQIFQFPANRESGDQSPAFLAAVLSMQRTDESGTALEEEPIELVRRIHKDLTKMRPGNASSREDDDPEDLGDELDTEGNCVFTEADAKINVNSSWGMFLRSLEERGIAASILHAGYMPDLVGIKGHAITQKAEKRTIAGRDVEPAYVIVDKVTYNPHTAVAKKGAAKATSASGKVNGAVKTNGVPAAGKPAAAAKAPTGATNSADAIENAEEQATQILTELASELNGETRDSKKLYAMAYSRLMKERNRDRSLDKAVQDFLKNEDWLSGKGAELELWSYDNGVFTFGEAVAA